MLASAPGSWCWCTRRGCGWSGVVEGGGWWGVGWVWGRGSSGCLGVGAPPNAPLRATLGRVPLHVAPSDQRAAHGTRPRPPPAPGSSVIGEVAAREQLSAFVGARHRHGGARGLQVAVHGHSADVLAASAPHDALRAGVRVVGIEARRRHHRCTARAGHRAPQAALPDVSLELCPSHCLTAAKRTGQGCEGALMRLVLGAAVERQPSAAPGAAGAGAWIGGAGGCACGHEWGRVGDGLRSRQTPQLRTFLRETNDAIWPQIREHGPEALHPHRVHCAGRGIGRDARERAQCSGSSGGIGQEGYDGPAHGGCGCSGSGSSTLLVGSGGEDVYLLADHVWCGRA